MARIPNSSPQTLGVLAALLEAEEEWHYGYALSQQTGLKSGTLYPILMRLAEQGWLERQWMPSEQPGRPPRHVYRLTGDGVREARQKFAPPRSARAAARLVPVPMEGCHV